MTLTIDGKASLDDLKELILKKELLRARYPARLSHFVLVDRPTFI
jgi:hypothetical protein